MSEFLQNEHAYVKVSCINGSSKGLFAKHLIKCGHFIVKVKGRAMPYCDDVIEYHGISEPICSNGDAIYCDNDCLSSYANDCIKILMPIKPRKLLQSLNDESVPFYERRNVHYNADFVTHKDGKIYLQAIRDIQPNEEICTHYGFTYWFSREGLMHGFAYEVEIEENGFPSDLCKFPAFLNYIKEFYPESTDLKIAWKTDLFHVLNIMKDNRILKVIKIISPEKIMKRCCVSDL